MYFELDILSDLEYTYISYLFHLNFLRWLSKDTEKIPCPEIQADIQYLESLLQQLESYMDRIKPGYAEQLREATQGKYPDFTWMNPDSEEITAITKF